MIARIQKSMKEKDQGFTLIELLVVMIIIGILAAIAVPVFLNQRKKAQDTAAKSDISTIGKEIATYFVDAEVKPTLAVTSAGYTLTPAGTGATAQNLGRVSVKTAVIDQSKVVDATNWCVGLSYADGTNGTVSYSVKEGLQNKACA